MRSRQHTWPRRFSIVHGGRPSRLRQRIHQVPNLAWEYLHHSLATPHHQPVVPDLNGKVRSHADHPLVQGTIRAQHLVFDGQVVCLAWTNEPIAGEAVLRLLGHEARLVVGGDVDHGAGSSLLTIVRRPPRPSLFERRGTLSIVIGSTPKYKSSQ
jgi:hypothetical protein